MADATLMADAPGAAATTTTASAPAAGTAAAGAATTVAAPEFKADEAVKFLTDHGVEAKALEGLKPEELKSRYDGAKTIADKASAAAKPKAPEKYEFKAPK